MVKKMLCLGYGYSARAFAAQLPRDWHATGTTRDEAKLAQITGAAAVLWPSPELEQELSTARGLLISAAPGDEGDPVLAQYGDLIARRAAQYDWVGYLSTTGVYGDHDGDWVDEHTPPAPTTARGLARMKAERAWLAVPGLPVHVFRLAGIYGPGRGPFAKLRSGKARRIIKPGQLFSRIHVDDIAQVLLASMAKPRPGAIYNVCDDVPAPPQDVLGFAAELLDLPPPPSVSFDEADMSPMARSFYSENKKVCNQRIHRELGVELRHRDYRSGLRAVLQSETNAAP